MEFKFKKTIASTLAFVMPFSSITFAFAPSLRAEEVRQEILKEYGIDLQNPDNFSSGGGYFVDYGAEEKKKREDAGRSLDDVFRDVKYYGSEPRKPEPFSYYGESISSEEFSNIYKDEWQNSSDLVSGARAASRGGRSDGSNGSFHFDNLKHGERIKGEDGRYVDENGNSLGYKNEYKNFSMDMGGLVKKYENNSGETFDINNLKNAREAEGALLKRNNERKARLYQEMKARQKNPEKYKNIPQSLDSATYEVTYGTNKLPDSKMSLDDPLFDVTKKVMRNYAEQKQKYEKNHGGLAFTDCSLNDMIADSVSNGSDDKGQRHSCVKEVINKYKFPNCTYRRKIDLKTIDLDVDLRLVEEVTNVKGEFQEGDVYGGRRGSEIYYNKEQVSEQYNEWLEEVTSSYTKKEIERLKEVQGADYFDRTVRRLHDIPKARGAVITRYMGDKSYSGWLVNDNGSLEWVNNKNINTNKISNIFAFDFINNKIVNLSNTRRMVLTGVNADNYLEQYTDKKATSIMNENDFPANFCKPVYDTGSGAKVLNAEKTAVNMNESNLILENTMLTLKTGNPNFDFNVIEMPTCSNIGLVKITKDVSGQIEKVKEDILSKKRNDLYIKDNSIGFLATPFNRNLDFLTNGGRGSLDVHGDAPSLPDENIRRFYVGSSLPNPVLIAPLNNRNYGCTWHCNGGGWDVVMKPLNSSYFAPDKYQDFKFRKYTLANRTQGFNAGSPYYMSLDVLMGLDEVTNMIYGDSLNINLKLKGSSIKEDFFTPADCFETAKSILEKGRCTGTVTWTTPKETGTKDKDAFQFVGGFDFTKTTNSKQLYCDKGKDYGNGGHANFTCYTKMTTTTHYNPREFKIDFKNKSLLTGDDTFVQPLRDIPDGLCLYSAGYEKDSRIIKDFLKNLKIADKDTSFFDKFGTDKSNLLEVNYDENSDKNLCDNPVEITVSLPDANHTQTINYSGRSIGGTYPNERVYYQGQSYNGFLRSLPRDIRLDSKYKYSCYMIDGVEICEHDSLFNQLKPHANPDIPKMSDNVYVKGAECTPKEYYEEINVEQHASPSLVSANTDLYKSSEYKVLHPDTSSETTTTDNATVDSYKISDLIVDFKEKTITDEKGNLVEFSDLMNDSSNLTHFNFPLSADDFNLASFNSTNARGNGYLTDEIVAKFKQIISPNFDLAAMFDKQKDERDNSYTQNVFTNSFDQIFAVNSNVIENGFINVSMMPEYVSPSKVKLKFNVDNIYPKDALSGVDLTQFKVNGTLYLELGHPIKVGGKIFPVTLFKDYINIVDFSNNIRSLNIEEIDSSIMLDLGLSLAKKENKVKEEPEPKEEKAIKGSVYYFDFKRGVILNEEQKGIGSISGLPVGFCSSNAYSYSENNAQSADVGSLYNSSIAKFFETLRTNDEKIKVVSVSNNGCSEPSKVVVSSERVLSDDKNFSFNGFMDLDCSDGVCKVPYIKDKYGNILKNIVDTCSEYETAIAPSCLDVKDSVTTTTTTETTANNTTTTTEKEEVKNRCKEGERNYCSEETAVCTKYDSLGGCTRFAKTFMCKDKPTSYYKQSQQDSCNAEVHCIDGDCVPIKKEKPEDWAKVAAMLHVAQQVAIDADCNVDENGALNKGEEFKCILFKGEMERCDERFGKNCCYIKAPGEGNISPLQLVTTVPVLVHTTQVLAAQTGMIAADSAFATPIGDMVSSIIGDVYDKIAKEIADSVIGKMYEQIKAAVKEMLSEAMKQLGIDVGADVGAGAAKEGAQAGAEAASSAITEFFKSGIGANLSMAFTVITWAYTAYQVANMLKQKAQRCSMGEYEVATKIRRKVCQKDTKYSDPPSSCVKKILGHCVRYRWEFCCQKSPLSRIIMEQVPFLTGGGKNSAMAKNKEAFDRLDSSTLPADVEAIAEKIKFLDNPRAGIEASKPVKPEPMPTDENNKRIELEKRQDKCAVSYNENKAECDNFNNSEVNALKILQAKYNIYVKDLEKYNKDKVKYDKALAELDAYAKEEECESVFDPDLGKKVERCITNEDAVDDSAFNEQSGEEKRSTAIWAIIKERGLYNEAQEGEAISACQGLTIEQFSNLDMNKLNLDEWVQIITTDVNSKFKDYSKKEFDIEEIVGTGSHFNIKELDSVRGEINGEGSTQKRSTAIEAIQKRIETRGEEIITENNNVQYLINDGSGLNNTVNKN